MFSANEKNTSWRRIIAAEYRTCSSAVPRSAAASFAWL